MTMEKQKGKGYQSGFVAILGRPNVGKSTLMNALVGEKVAITSARAQTTRSRIMGVMTRENLQIVFLDTPGVHHPRNKLGEYMMSAVKDALDGVDAVIVMLDATDVRPTDIEIIRKYDALGVKWSTRSTWSIPTRLRRCWTSSRWKRRMRSFRFPRRRKTGWTAW